MSARPSFSQPGQLCPPPFALCFRGLVLQQSTLVSLDSTNMDYFTTTRTRTFFFNYLLFIGNLQILWIHLLAYVYLILRKNRMIYKPISVARVIYDVDSFIYEGAKDFNYKVIIRR